MKFKKRQDGSRPSVTSTYSSDTGVDHQIRVGDKATLEPEHEIPNDVKIIVSITKIHGANCEGTIMAFENYEEDTFMGKKEGDSIEFTLDDVRGGAIR